tara:strand:- start:86 stop:760 length:675 start_codon:yes stop_codon:yes gene_type:complete
MNTCIIPVRKNSQRLKKKNYQKIGKFTVLELAIIKALKSKVFDNIVINTDDIKLKKIAHNFGVNFYLRDPNLANSTATSDQLVLDFFKNYETDRVFWVNTASPLQTVNDIRKFVLNFIKKSRISSVSANNFQLHSYYKNMPINFIKKKGFARTQDLKPIQVINYAMMGWHKSCVEFLINGELFSKKNFIYESSKWSGILLKNKEDLEIVRALYPIAPDQGHKNI